MDIQKLINELKAQFETLSKKAQGLFKVSANAGQQSLVVVSDNAQALVKVQTAAAKDVYEIALASFNKAKTAGLQKVAAKPVDYLPSEGAERIVAAAQETVELLTQAGEELVDVLRKGYKSVLAKLQGKKPAARKAKRTTVRKTTAKKATAAA
ncbi:MAG: hypothetical protein ACRESV_00570 [Nevskiales bacterium]